MEWEAGGGWTGLYSSRLGMIQNEAGARKSQARVRMSVMGDPSMTWVIKAFFSHHIETWYFGLKGGGRKRDKNPLCLVAGKIK